MIKRLTFCYLILILFFTSCKYPLFVSHTVKRDGFFKPMCFRMICRQHYKKIKKDKKRTAGLYADNPLNYAKTSKNKPQNKAIHSDSLTVKEPINEVAEILAEQSLVLENVYFKSNTSVLESSSFPSLDTLVARLKMENNLFIQVIGHTDNIGKEAYNDQLSQKRAEAIGNYLVLKGISKERVECIGLGSRERIDKSGTEDGNAKNRRVEIKLSQTKY